MEEDPRYLPVKSIFLKQSTVQKQLDQLRDTVEEAEDLIHYEQAHNPEILFAIDIIERFLRKKKRGWSSVCSHCRGPTSSFFVERGMAYKTSPNSVHSS